MVIVFVSYYKNRFFDGKRSWFTVLCELPRNDICDVKFLDCTIVPWSEMRQRSLFLSVVFGGNVGDAPLTPSFLGFYFV